LAWSVNIPLKIKVFPEAGKKFINREVLQKGMVTKAAIAAFTKEGFF